MIAEAPRDPARTIHLQSAQWGVFALTSACRERFVAAADLVQVGGPTIDALRSYFWEPTGTGLLNEIWFRLCERYMAECHDPQLAFFESDPEHHLQNHWDRYAREELLPALVRDGELVRNVLRVSGGLPCRSREEAADAILVFIDEMTLPTRRPRWESVEEPRG